MKRSAYEELMSMSAPSDQTLHIRSLGSPYPRTLAYGYTRDRHSWHAYVLNSEIHVAIYNYAGGLLSHVFGTEIPFSKLRPDKRVYPERTSALFAYLMLQSGNPLPFTEFNDEWGTPNSNFYGRVFDADGNQVL